MKRLIPAKTISSSTATVWHARSCHTVYSTLNIYLLIRAQKDVASPSWPKTVNKHDRTKSSVRDARNTEFEIGIAVLEPTELNQTLIGQHIAFLEYPDGTVAMMHKGRKLNYSIFNKLLGLQQNEVVENKRLGSVLAHIQQQHEELDKQNKRSRSKKSMPSRKAQKAIIEQRKLNPVLDSCG